MFVNFIHPVTGEKRQVKIGWSWTLFFFGTFFGIPFFIRKMYSWAILMCLLLISYLTTVFLSIESRADEANLYLTLFQFALFGLQGYFLVDGNKMTAKYYLNQGFRIENDDEFVKKQVKIAWKFTDDVFVENNLKEEK